ncbi:MAG: GNAT family N-acetyltransferase [Acidiferrobacterales bacterium]|nr:GNAT family N-acetyltransferase [Acidiferrobacterales bacterium]
MEPRITTDLAEMDFNLIHDFISESYWAKGISKAVLKKALEHSLCFAIFEGTQQRGFARMVTDRATYAYLADVFILPEHQGRGLSKQLLTFIFVHPDLQGLRRITLATADAHGLYEKFGFTPLSDEKIFMESWDPDVYKMNSVKK